MDTGDVQARVCELLAAERAIKRTMTFRIFARLAGARWLVPLTALFLVIGISGLASLYLKVPEIFMAAPIPFSLCLLLGMIGLAVKLHDRKLGQIRQQLEKLPSADVAAAQERFATGGVIALSDWLRLVSAIVLAAILGIIALDLYREGHTIMALLVATLALGGLVAFRWRVRGWKVKS